MNFSGDHYKFNRIFLSVIGLWPHRHITLRQIQGIISSVVLISVTSPQLIKLFTIEYDVTLVLRILSSVLPFLLFIVKYVTFYFITENISELMQQIKTDWNILKDNNELEIIHRYTKVARLYTMSIATLIYMCLFIIICIQYVPCILDVVMPLNNSRRVALLFQVEYLVNHEEYYHVIQLHLHIGLLVAATTVLATESFCLTLSIHAFAMFKIASYRMQRIIDKNSLNLLIEKHCALYKNVVAAVDGHRRAIEFSECIKRTFTIPYLALILLGVTSTSVNLFLLFQVITSMTSMDDLMRSIVFVVCHLIYMFLTNYAGQKFIDHAVDVYQKICNVRWYNAPLRIQKHLLFIMQKAIKSYCMDVGGLYNPSLQGFTTLASASLSYFTVLCSI
ncbi:hypothetical protein DMN91_009716 [Ooceraea biroi]|uniref:Odorant receptor n=2 Tax=Ooceraea biroi TaxID=2015173 RepID=A0A3L8DAZ4_OOCBI|nr:hypothetical protein DMN91_009716 [Ooceraea biroi]